MDDVPLETAETGSNPYRIGTTQSNADAKKVEARGIVGLVTDLAAIFDEIALGVRAAKPGRVDPEEWADIFQDVALEAVLKLEKDPKYFGAGKPKHWASHAARNLRRNNERDEGYRVMRNLAYMRFRSTGALEVKQPDAEFDERERDRAIAQLFAGVNPRHRKAVEAYLVGGLTLDVAAAVGGVSERALRRALEKVRREAPFKLGDWHPNSSKKGRQSRPGNKPSTDRGTDDDQRS